jgi:hypothetical protein
LDCHYLTVLAKRLILFRRLGHSELRVARFFRWLGFEIRFLEPVDALRREAVVEELRAEGIVWLKASELAGINAFAPIAAGHELSVDFLDRFFPPEALAILARGMRPPTDDPRTLRVLLYELVCWYLMPHGLAVTVARLLREKGYRVWLWQQDAVMLSLARPGFRNLHPGLPSLVAKFTERVRSRFVGRARSRQPTADLQGSALTCNTRAPVEAAEVLFFPHHGPYFGDLFLKDQYYSDDPTSPFHRTQICHVELAEWIAQEARPAVQQAYERAGIAVHWLPTIGRSRISPVRFARLALRIGPAAAFLGLSLRHRLAASYAQVSVFSRARLALLGYETQFPRMMAAALQARGVAVAAAQERFVQPFHPGFHLLVDHYLVQGERPAAAVHANPLCRVGSIAITGDLRQPRWKRERRSGSHRCLVLDYHSVRSPFSDAFAIGNGWASNRLFLEDILQLSEDFPEIQFTVRGKDTDWTDLPAFAGLVARAAARSNLTIDRDRSLDRSYVLLAGSDSVVARHTSLGDQALAIGIPVLFHERMATGTCSIAAVMDYAPYPILTRSYAELRERFAAIVQEGHILDAAQLAKLRREFYSQPADRPPKEKAAEVLNSLLAGAHKPSRRGAVGASSLTTMADLR